MGKKQQVQETVFNGSRDEGEGWPPEDPAGFSAWFQERIERIPPEHRAKAKIEISSQGGYYGEHTGCIEITYLREETDEQFAARLKREEEQRQQLVAQEKRMLVALLAKHGAL